MHQKRKAIPKLWALARTGTKYLAVSDHNQRTSIPLVVVLRDMLKLVQTKKELKGLLYKKQIKVNTRIVEEGNYPIQLFDTLSLVDAKKNYRAVIKGKRIAFEEITDKENSIRAYKVLDKKIMAGKKIQINLDGGRNLITNEKINPGEFVIMTSDNKINKVITLKKDVEVITIEGKHIGKEGKIKDIFKEGENTLATIITPKKEEVKVNINNLYAKI
jgi:small subunit ribosomal protein S4e